MAAGVATLAIFPESHRTRAVRADCHDSSPGVFWSDSGLFEVTAVTTTVGVYRAKTQLPRLLARVARGQRITITRHGTPVAILIPAGGGPRRPLADVIAELQVFGRGRTLGRVRLRRLIERGRR